MEYQVVDFSEDNVVDIGTYDSLELAIAVAKNYIASYQDGSPLFYEVQGTLVGIDNASDEEDYNPKVYDNECDII